MAQFGGIVPSGIDLSQYKGVPKSMIRTAEKLSDHNPERDKRLRVEFFQDSYFETHKSKLAGRMMFSTRDFIRVITDAKSEYCQMIKFDEQGEPYANIRKWLTRFPLHWDEYRKGKIDGTPLKALPNLDPGLAATLEHTGVNTLESLSALEGVMLDQIPGLLDAKRKAKAFLESSDVLLLKGKENEALKAELADAERRIAELKAMMSDSAVEAPQEQPTILKPQTNKRKK